MADEDLLARLRRLEDERAIVDRVYAYPDGVNSGQREVWLDCFTEDATFAHRLSPDGEWRLRGNGRAARSSTPPSARAW